MKKNNMLNKNPLRLILLLPAWSVAIWLSAQDAVQRDVVVERDYEPIMQQATKPGGAPVEKTYAEPEETQPQWSNRNGVVDYTIQNIPAQEAAFRAPRQPHGHLRAGLGHPQTLFQFDYKHSDRQHNSLVLGIDHEGEWGLKAVAHTDLRLSFTHAYRSGKIYFNLDGGNEYFTRYGRYFNDAAAYPTPTTIPSGWGHHLDVRRSSQLLSQDKQNIWKANILLGAQSTGNSDLSYQTEVGYRLTHLVGIVTEHQVNARINLSYRIDDHKVGAKIYSQNQFMIPSDSAQAYLDADPKKPINSRHAMRIEPYYEYHGRRLMVHAGINLDFNIGKGNLHSTTDDTTPLARQVAFAPSPNVRIEAQLAPRWAVLYADVRGSLGTSAIPAYISMNRYQNILTALHSHHVSGYKPVDGELGLMFRPQRDLLLQVHTGYAYMLNQAIFVSQTPDDRAPYSWENPAFVYTDFQRWKVGAQIAYHYQDIIDLHIWGDYYIYQGIRNNTAGKTFSGQVPDFTVNCIYDRPDWVIGMDIKGRIDSHWSLYLKGDIQGSRTAFIYNANQPSMQGDRRLPVYADLNTGVLYEFHNTRYEALNRLSLFCDLQNILHRKNVLWYGYESQGIHGRVGAAWSF